MAFEIERRFLVDPKRLPKLKPGQVQVQGYLNQAPDKKTVEVRIRIEKQKATLALKAFKTKLTRWEFEYPLPFREAEQILRLTPYQVTKVRHHLEVSGKTWVIDFFRGANFPLVIAEVELKTEKEKLELPLWVTKEVTNNLAFTAAMLAFKPFQSWTKSDLKKTS